MKTTRFDFMGKRRLALTISAVCILASLIFLMVRGLNLGIDFTGGNLVQVEFEKDVSVADVRNALAKTNQANSVIQAYSSKGVIIRIVADKEDDRKVLAETLKTSFPGAKIVRFEKVGPVVGSELRQEAVIALCIALIGILLYITVRFQFRFAVVSVLALVHDSVITIGAFSLTGMEVSSTFIAAILTIVGYSLNDTIIIYDRIRENRKLMGPKADYGTLVDTSINQTLTRSLYTAGCTFAAIAVVYIVSVMYNLDSVQTFALPMMVGIITGCYSSVCVAGPLYVMWQKHKQQKKQQAVASSR